MGPPDTTDVRPRLATPTHSPLGALSEVGWVAGEEAGVHFGLPVPVWNFFLFPALPAEALWYYEQEEVQEIWGGNLTRSKEGAGNDLQSGPKEERASGTPTVPPTSPAQAATSGIRGEGATPDPGRRRRGAGPSRKDEYGIYGFLLLTSANTYLKINK